MSAKKPRPPAPSPAPAAPATPAVETTAPAAVAWIDSADPKQRQLAKLVLGAVWVYVAALWLLALDQWLHWGLFGPKAPPVP